MIGTRPYLFSIILIGLAASTSSGSGRDKRQEAVEPLPKVFNPLSWEVREPTLKKILPNGIYEQTEYRDPFVGSPVLAVMVHGLQWPDLGEATATLIFVKNSDAAPIYVEIATDDRRPQCQVDVDLPPLCRTAYGPNLRHVFDMFYKQLSVAYGQAEVTSPGKSEREADRRERRAAWARRGYRLGLQMSSDDGGRWAVSVSADRRPQSK